MGLDWRVRKRGVVDMSNRVGSYRHWQDTRRQLFDAAMSYAKDKGLTSLEDELKKWQQPVRDIDVMWIGPFNYKFMAENPPKLLHEHYKFLHGLHQFISHSDTDGQHSYRIAGRILAVYQTVATYMTDEDEKEWWNTVLVPLLEASIEHQTPIIYC